MQKQREPIPILLVDDDPDCRQLMREAIEESKIATRVYEVSDGQSALDFVFRRGPFRDVPRPALIYLDIEMPGLSGQQVLREIKSSATHRDIPIVMMTGVADEDQIECAARNGANSYTLKPTNAEQLLRTVMVSTDYWMHVHQYPTRQFAACAA